MLGVKVAHIIFLIIIDPEGLLKKTSLKWTLYEGKVSLLKLVIKGYSENAKKQFNKRHNV